MDKDEATPSKGTAEGPVSRETMVEYLTGEGRLRTPLAERLYAEGLDTWEKLMEGDKEYFTSFKGVGPKTSGVLIELGERKRDEFTEREAVSGDVREFLGGIQRVTGTVIEAMVEAGYDSVGRIADSEPSALRNVKGVGPKLSETIHAEAVKYSSEYPDLKYGPLGEPEEAVPLLAESEETREGEIVEGEKEGILGRLVRAIKGFFSTKKEEKTEVSDEPSKEESHVPPTGGDMDSKHVSPEREETPSTGEDRAETSLEAGGSGPEKAKEPAEEEPAGPVEVDPRAEEEEEGDGAAPAGEKEPEDGKAPEEEPSGTAAGIGVPGEPEEPEEATGEKRGPGVFRRVRSFFSGRKGQPEGDSPEKGEGQKGETPTLGEKEGEGERQAPEEKVEEEPGGPVTKKEELERMAEELEREGDEAGGIRDFEDIPGVSEGTIKLLREAGYLDIGELREAVWEDLTMIEGVDEKTARHICQALEED